MDMKVGGEKLWRLKEEDEYGRRRWKEGWSEYIEYKKELTCVKWRSNVQNYVKWPKKPQKWALVKKIS